MKFASHDLNIVALRISKERSKRRKQTKSKRKESYYAYSTVVGQHSSPKGNIIRYVRIKLTGVNTSKWYPQEFRLVEAKVEINGKMKKMTFITNNLDWSANSICDLYKARWAIEVFFKEIKQTLKIAVYW